MNPLSLTQTLRSFQFLDYPVLVVHAKGGAEGGSGGASAAGALVPVSSGKSCVFRADPEELAFLLQQARGELRRGRRAARPGPLLRSLPAFSLFTLPATRPAPPLTSSPPHPPRLP
jgi:hypothetical protein